MQLLVSVHLRELKNISTDEYLVHIGTTKKDCSLRIKCKIAVNSLGTSRDQGQLDRGQLDRGQWYDRQKGMVTSNW